MTGTLHDTIHQLAADFAAGVLGVIRGASLEDILAETESAVRRGRGRPPPPPERSPRASRSGRKGRLQRRSAADIGKVVDEIVELLSGKPKGLRAEQIRAALGLSAKELPRPIAQALSSKRLAKTGRKRATTYYAPGRGGGSAKGGSGGRRKRTSKGNRRAAKQAVRGAKESRSESSSRPVSRANEAAANGAAEGT